MKTLNWFLCWLLTLGQLVNCSDPSYLHSNQLAICGQSRIACTHCEANIHAVWQRSPWPRQNKRQQLVEPNTDNSDSPSVNAKKETGLEKSYIWENQKLHVPLQSAKLKHFGELVLKHRRSIRRMAWRSLGVDNADLIRQLRENGVISSDGVAQAMANTDRKFYSARNPYLDAPQSIGHGVTISAPHMHAFALEYLRERLRPGARVLDVGSGSGYLTACFLRYIQAKGDDPNTRVVGIEHQPELVEQSIKNLNSDDAALLTSGQLVIKEGDGRLGCPEHAPYDAIHVGAAAAKTPTALIEQLAKGGRLIVPVGPEGGEQYMTQYDKDAQGNVKESQLMGVMYVPLTDLKRS